MPYIPDPVLTMLNAAATQEAPTVLSQAPGAQSGTPAPVPTVITNDPPPPFSSRQEEPAATPAPLAPRRAMAPRLLKLLTLLVLLVAVFGGGGAFLAREMGVLNVDTRFVGGVLADLGFLIKPRLASVAIDPEAMGQISMTLDYAGGGAARLTMPAGMLEAAQLLVLSVLDRMLLLDLAYSRAFAFGWLSEDAMGLPTQP